MDGRILIRTCTISNLALACLNITTKYNDTSYIVLVFGYVITNPDPNSLSCYTLSIFTLNVVQYRHKTIEDININSKIQPRGTALYKMFNIVDLFRKFIQSINSFLKAIAKFASIGLFQININKGKVEEHSKFTKTLKETLKQIIHYVEIEKDARRLVVSKSREQH